MTETLHPSLEYLADLAAGMLGALERSQLERHVAECKRCAADLRWLTATIGEPVGGSPMPIEDVGVFTRARRLLSRRPAGVAQRVPAAQFRAALRFDSATMPPAYGMRGGADAGIRQLLFEAGPFEIELHTRADRAGWVVSGQVLGPTEATTGEVRLIGDRASARSSLSQLLEFTLSQVPPGRYRLELQLQPGALLQVESLRLGT